MIAKTNKKRKDNGFTNEDMVLYRQHSDYIQQTLVSARKRTFKDAISTLANDLASDQELNSNMCILGEVLNREEKKPEQKDDKATNDSEKNVEQILERSLITLSNASFRKPLNRSQHSDKVDFS